MAGRGGAAGSLAGGPDALEQRRRQPSADRDAGGTPGEPAAVLAAVPVRDDRPVALPLSRSPEQGLRVLRRYGGGLRAGQAGAVPQRLQYDRTAAGAVRQPQRSSELQAAVGRNADGGVGPALC